MSAESLEQRLAALEAEVVRLRETKADKKEMGPWWKKMVGAFADDPVFEEAMKYGREYRESTRPKPRKRKKK